MFDILQAFNFELYYIIYCRCSFNLVFVIFSLPGFTYKCEKMAYYWAFGFYYLIYSRCSLNLWFNIFDASIYFFIDVKQWRQPRKIQTNYLLRLCAFALYYIISIMFYNVFSIFHNVFTMFYYIWWYSYYVWLCSCWLLHILLYTIMVLLYFANI